MVRPVTIFGNISYWGTGTQIPKGPRPAVELSRHSQHLGSVGSLTNLRAHTCVKVATFDHLQLIVALWECRLSVAYSYLQYVFHRS